MADVFAQVGEAADARRSSRPGMIATFSFCSSGCRPCSSFVQMRGLPPVIEAKYAPGL
jgi:hypothetical protein